METPPEESKLRTVPFAAHATRGVIRDSRVRRKVMFVLVIAAVLMVLAGATILQGALDPREHFGWFAAYWLACGWLTITAVLMAVYDLLIVRVERRTAERALRGEIARSASESPDERDA